MKKALFAFSFLVLTAISCSKDDPAPSGDGTVYMSLSAGSTRNYEFTNNNPPTPASPYTVTSTNRDTTINARSYHVFTNSAGGFEYYYFSGSDYYSYQSLPAALGSASIENLYLKTNAAVNATWNQSTTVTIPQVPFPVTVNFANKIMEKGISRVVNGITYTDVIHVKTDLSASTIAGPVTGLTTDIHYYYAPRVGMIENTTVIDLDFMGFISHTNTKTILKSAIIL
jgi:hypothetical protein